MAKSRRRWLGSALVLLALIWMIHHLAGSATWRQFSAHRLLSLLVHAHPAWLGGAVAGTGLSYVIRAYRWRFFLDPIRRASLWTLLKGQIFGFSAIYLFGRPGELVRPAYIAKRERVSFASQLAILILERIYDTVALAVLFALALYFQPLHLQGQHAARTLRRMHEGALLVLALTAATVLTLAWFRFYSRAVLARGAQRWTFLPARVRAAVGRLSRAFAEGLEVIENWRDLAASLASTLVLWVINASVFWMTFRSLGGAAGQLSWWATGFVMFFAALGLVLQLPGVGGGYQVGVIVALREIFRVPPEGATSAAILVWIVIFVPCLALSLVLLVFEGLSFRKLGAWAEQQAAGREKGVAGEAG